MLTAVSLGGLEPLQHPKDAACRLFASRGRFEPARNIPLEEPKWYRCAWAQIYGTFHTLGPKLRAGRVEQACRQKYRKRKAVLLQNGKRDGVVVREPIVERQRDSVPWWGRILPITSHEIGQANWPVMTEQVLDVSLERPSRNEIVIQEVVGIVVAARYAVISQDRRSVPLQCPRDPEHTTASQCRNTATFHWCRAPPRVPACFGSGSGTCFRRSRIMPSSPKAARARCRPAAPICWRIAASTLIR